MYSKINRHVDSELRLESIIASRLYGTLDNKEEENVREKLSQRYQTFLQGFRNNLKIGMFLLGKENSDDMDESELKQIYRLSTIDVFVEKAIVILESEADSYRKIGMRLLWTAAVPIVIGIFIAFVQVYPEIAYHFFPSIEKFAEKRENTDHNKSAVYVNLYKEINLAQHTDDNTSTVHSAFIQSMIDREVALSWKEVLANFVKSFTLYGLLVLSAVILKRFGKAMIDQSERLYNRRHALREGRLYLHLQNGRVETVEEFDKVFNWNATQNNAFADIPTDAQAPWGTAFKEALNIIPKTVEASKGK